MSRPIRIIFGKTERATTAPADFDEFKIKAASLFPIPFSESYKIYYNDSDGDLITITNSDDYTLALGQEVRELAFYISNTSECARELIASSGGPKFSQIESCYEKAKAVDHPEVKATSSKPLIETYACLGCDGRKTNSKGTKSCKLCLGTGRVTDEFLEKVRAIIRAQLSAELEPQFMIAASQLLESQKELVQEKSKLASESVVYKIGSSNKQIEYRSKLIKEVPESAQTLKPKEEFTKVWTLKNIGNFPWPISTTYKYAGGDYIETITDPVGDVKPGEIVDIKIRGQAPGIPGHYVMCFRLTYEENQGFGDKPWIDITVKKFN